VEHLVLANGLTVILSTDQRLPVAAVEVRYLVGAAHERPARSGFAHLFEHLMFQGAAHYNREYFDAFEPIGAAVNGTTNQDRTNYFERVPRNYLERALWMESDRMFNLLPVLTQQKLDNQRDVVRNERRQSYENQPYGLVGIHLPQALYPAGHPYHEPVIGSHADLTSATLADVKSFFREYYVPANAVLTVVGDFDASRVRRLAVQYFGRESHGKRATLPSPELPRIERRLHLTYPDRVELPRIHLVWHTPRLFAPGDAELDLWARVLGGGKTSRLYRALIYDAKLASGVEAVQVSQGLSSFFLIEATAAPGTPLAKLERGLLDALKAATQDPPTPDAMRRAVNGYRKQLYAQVETVTSRAHLLADYFQFAGTPRYLEQDLRRYTSASAEAVHAAARRWLPLDKYLRIDVVPQSTAGTPDGTQARARRADP
jgi:zinc protease